MTDTAAKPSIETQAITDEDILASVAGAAWHGKSLVVADREKVEKRIRRRNLSASTSNSVSGCAARFAIESMLPRVENPLAPAPLGTGAHSILERFYNLPNDKRTLRALRRQVKPVTVEQLAAYEGTPQYDDLFAEVSKTIGEWAEGIYKLENPAEVNVYRNELAFKGIKLSNGVPFVGYLDRTRIDGDPDNLENATLHIDDYKFGGKVSRPNPRFGDHYGDQIRVYSDAIEGQFGKPPATGQTLWPRQGQIVPIDLSVAAKRATLASFARSWDYMNSVADAATFPAVPGNLCGWCPAANSCPVAQIKTDKAKTAAATQHGGENGPVALGIPTVREFAAPPRTITVESSAALAPTPTTTTAQEAPMSSDKLQFPTNKWAAMSTASITDTAATHLAIYDQPLKPITIHSLAYALGGIVEEVARDVFMGGFDWSFDSTSRIVYSLGQSLRSRPAPFGQDQAAWEQWRKTLVGLTSAKLRVAIPMVDVANFGAPDFDALIVHTTVPTPKTTAGVPAEEAEPALA